MKQAARLIFIGLIFSASRGTAAEPALSLPDLLSRAREANPEIIAARQTWKVARAQIAPAGTWPDPTFSYIDENFASGMAGVPPETIHHYRVEQTIPFPGKLTSDARMKYHEALISQANYQVKLIDILNQVRMRYYQLYLTDEKIELAAESTEILRNVLKTTQARLASNQSSGSDVFIAQIELRKMENNLFEQQQQRTLIQAELNTLLNNSADTALRSAQAPELVDLPVSLEALQTLARQNDPLYLSAMHEVNHSRAMMNRSRLQFAPDLGFMYEKEVTPVGPPGGQIGFSVTFPLWFRRPWAQFQGAKEHLMEAEAMSQASENMVRKMVHMEFTEVNTRLRLARNYLTRILPASMSNLKVSRELYAGGQGDFLRLLEAFRMWIGTHSEYQEQLYQYGAHWSELERWVGLDLAGAREVLRKMKSTPEENHEY